MLEDVLSHLDLLLVTATGKVCTSDIHTHIPIEALSQPDIFLLLCCFSFFTSASFDRASQST